MILWAIGITAYVGTFAAVCPVARRYALRVGDTGLQAALFAVMCGMLAPVILPMAFVRYLARTTVIGRALTCKSVRSHTTYRETMCRRAEVPLC